MAGLLVVGGLTNKLWSSSKFHGPKATRTLQAMKQQTNWPMKQQKMIQFVKSGFQHHSHMGEKANKKTGPFNYGKITGMGKKKEDTSTSSVLKLKRPTTTCSSSNHLFLYAQASYAVFTGWKLCSAVHGHSLQRRKKSRKGVYWA